LPLKSIRQSPLLASLSYIGTSLLRKITHYQQLDEVN
jgi:hypothetical protein